MDKRTQQVADTRRVIIPGNKLDPESTIIILIPHELKNVKLINCISPNDKNGAYKCSKKKVLDCEEHHEFDGGDALNEKTPSPRQSRSPHRDFTNRLSKSSRSPQRPEDGDKKPKPRGRLSCPSPHMDPRTDSPQRSSSSKPHRNNSPTSPTINLNISFAPSAQQALSPKKVQDINLTLNADENRPGQWIIHTNAPESKRGKSPSPDRGTRRRCRSRGGGYSACNSCTDCTTNCSNVFTDSYILKKQYFDEESTDGWIMGDEFCSEDSIKQYVAEENDCDDHDTGGSVYESNLLKKCEKEEETQLLRALTQWQVARRNLLNVKADLKLMGKDWDEKIRDYAC